MSSGEVLIRGGYVATVDPALGDLPGADVLVADGRITAVAPGLTASPGARVIDARDRLVLPGLVDTHRHTWLGAINASVAAVSLTEYSRTVMRDLAPHYLPEDSYAGTLWGALQALNAGVTTVADWAHNLPSPEHADANIRALRDSGIRGVFLYGGNDPAEVQDTYFPPGSHRLTMGLALRGPHFATAHENQADFALARDLGLPISIHAGMAGFPGAVDELDKLGLLGPDVNYAHATEFAPREFELVAASGGSIAISPSVDMTMALGAYPATGQALAHGIPAGLAADTVASSGTDLFSEMRLALAAERSRAITPVPLDHRDMLHLATAGGARVWRLDDEIGTLTPGKRADIVVVDLRPPHLDGFGDPVLSLLVGAGPADVETVLADGVVVKADGKLVHPIVDEARHLMRSSRQRLRRRQTLRSTETTTPSTTA